MTDNQFSITVIGSGSSGNCYYVKYGTNGVLLDAGISYKDTLKKIKSEMLNVDMLCVTHSHGDHAKYVKEYLQRGIKCIMSSDTKYELGLKDDYGVLTINSCECIVDRRYIENRIHCFPIKHDVPNLAYYICFPKLNSLKQLEIDKKVLYITDTYDVSFDIEKDTTHLILECNYDEAIMHANEVGKNGYLLKLNERIRRAHLSLDKCMDFLNRNLTDNIEEVWLCHLSSQNSDAELFKSKAEQIVAQKGLSTKIYIA